MEAPDLSGDRWLTITDQDQRGTILVIAIICCVYCPMILALRAVTSFKNLGVDDFLALAATLTGVVQYAIVFAAVSNGLGEAFDDITPADGLLLGRLTIASEVLFFITICLTKCSVVLFCRKLFGIGMKKHIFVCDSAAALCGIWGLGSILAVTVSCGPLEHIGFKAPFCDNLGSRWTGVAIADAATEVLIFLLAVVVVVPLQMRLQRKVAVVLSFAPRLINIVLISLHARAVHRLPDAPTPGVNLTVPTVYLQVQLIYGIITAAIPALNRSLRLFNTSMGSSWWQTTVSHSYGKSGHSASRGRGDIPLKSVITSNNRSQARSPERSEITNEPTTKLRPDQVGYTFTSSGVQLGEADARSGRSQDSTDSKARIIRKETHWQVTYDRSPS